MGTEEQEIEILDLTPASRFRETDSDVDHASPDVVNRVPTFSGVGDDDLDPVTYEIFSKVLGDLDKKVAVPLEKRLVAAGIGVASILLRWDRSGRIEDPRRGIDARTPRRSGPVRQKRDHRSRLLDPAVDDELVPGWAKSAAQR